jgi:hypothetical protein
MKKWFLILLLAAAIPAFSQNAPYAGSCTQGGTQAQTSGIKSSNFQLSNFPSCQVNVYLHNTVTRATLYSDSIGTPLANPFTADSNGLYKFYALTSGSYDITMSAAGMVTTTIPDVRITSGGTIPTDTVITDPASSQFVTHPQGTQLNVNSLSGGGVFPYKWVTVGDSLTQGLNGLLPYPYQLKQLLGANGINFGIGGDTSSQVLARYTAVPELHNYCTFIWVGRNNVTDQTQIRADVASIVSQVANGCYIVLSQINDASEPSGSPDYTAIVATNNYWATLYGSKYVNVRGALVAAYNPNDPQDVIDHGQDIPPSSLRADGTHLNTQGNAVVAAQVNTAARSNFPATFNRSPYVVPSNAYTSQTTGVPIAPVLANVGSQQTDMAPLGTELTGSSGWTQTNWTGTYSTGFTHTPGNTSAMSYPAVVNATNYYEVFFQITAGTAGSVSATLGGQQIINSVDSSTKFSAISQYVSGPQALTTAGIIFTPTTDFNGTISNVSVKQITSSVPSFTLQDSTRSDSIWFRAPLAINYSHGIGYQSLAFLTLGQQNVGEGYRSLFHNTTGSYNTAGGALSMQSNTLGSNNTAWGQASLLSNTVGMANSAFGAQAGLNLTSGGNNVCVGFWACRATTTGSFNIHIGSQAGSSAATTNQTVLIGNNAGVSNTTDGVVFIGFGAGLSNTTGVADCIGLRACIANTTGGNVTAFGRQAAQNSSTASNIVAIGSGAGQNTTTVGDYIAVGVGALNADVTGQYNTVTGNFGMAATTGGSNSGFGHNVLNANTTGNGNVAFGINSGVTSTPANANVTGSDNTWIGTNTGPSSTTQVSNSIAIGFGATNSASNQAIIGNAGTSQTVLFGTVYRNSAMSGNEFCQKNGTNCQASVLSGLTGSIGGGALTAGNCTTGTVTVTGVVTGSPVAVSASDGTLPDPLIVLRGAVTASNTVTVQLCAIANVTPAAKTYNVRVIN